MGPKSGRKSSWYRKRPIGVVRIEKPIDRVAERVPCEFRGRSMAVTAAPSSREQTKNVCAKASHLCATVVRRFRWNFAVSVAYGNPSSQRSMSGAPIACCRCDMHVNLVPYKTHEKSVVRLRFWWAGPMRKPKTRVYRMDGRVGNNNNK